jgi:RNA polymerase sigma factor (sigma-70 family)
MYFAAADRLCFVVHSRTVCGPAPCQHDVSGQRHPLPGDAGYVGGRRMDGDDVGALVLAAANGERAAWDELVSRFKGLVWGVARGHRLPQEDVAEVFQTTWLRLVENLARLREPDRVGAWLATTARRESLRIIQQKGRETDTDPVLLDLHVDGDPAPDDALLRTERDEVLWQCLDTMPERCRVLLRVLMSDPPLSYLEVAKVLDMPVGSIGPTRGRCLEHLRRRLVEAGVGADWR